MCFVNFCYGNGADFHRREILIDPEMSEFTLTNGNGRIFGGPEVSPECPYGGRRDSRGRCRVTVQ